MQNIRMREDPNKRALLSFENYSSDQFRSHQYQIRRGWDAWGGMEDRVRSDAVGQEGRAPELLRPRRPREQCTDRLGATGRHQRVGGGAGIWFKNSKIILPAVLKKY